LNLAWLQHQHKQLSDDKFDSKVKALKEQTKHFEYHQACLWQQINSSVMNEHIKLNFTPDFRDFILSFYSIPAHRSCAAYLTSDKHVLCDHLTLHFYSFNKYMKLFEYIQEQYQATVPTKNNQIDLIHPKDLFCNRCYDQYKDFTHQPSIISDAPKPPYIIPHKYIIFKYKNRLNFLRTRFTDQCDIKPNTMKNHQGEWIVTKEVALAAQAQLIFSIGMEINLLNETLIKEDKANKQAKSNWDF
jgi:hypothetical protein